MPPPPSVAILNHRSQPPGTTPSKVERHYSASSGLNPLHPPYQGSTGLRRCVVSPCPGPSSTSWLRCRHFYFYGAIDAKSTGGGRSLFGRLAPAPHSCPLLQSCLPDSSSRTPSPHSRAVPCLVLSVQFSACLVTSPTFVLFSLSFCQPIKETKNRLIAILVWRRTYQEAEDDRTKK